MCCDPDDFERDFGSSEMYQVIDRHANSILLYITVPPPPRKSLLSQHSEADVATGNQIPQLCAY